MEARRVVRSLGRVGVCPAARTKCTRFAGEVEICVRAKTIIGLTIRSAKGAGCFGGRVRGANTRMGMIGAIGFGIVGRSMSGASGRSTTALSRFLGSCGLPRDCLYDGRARGLQHLVGSQRELIQTRIKRGGRVRTLVMDVKLTSRTEDLRDGGKHRGILSALRPGGSCILRTRSMGLVLRVVSAFTRGVGVVRGRLRRLAGSSRVMGLLLAVQNYKGVAT